jgi:hypothetical protein
MQIACKASCNNCKALQTPTPFSQVQLSSGWVMPTVGFGTAGLGVGTAAAVEYAAAAGYRMFDSAEVSTVAGVTRCRKKKTGAGHIEGRAAAELSWTHNGGGVAV